MPHDVSVEPISLKTDHGAYIAKFRAIVVWKSTCRKYIENKSLSPSGYFEGFQRCPLMGKPIPKFDSTSQENERGCSINRGNRHFRVAEHPLILSDSAIIRNAWLSLDRPSSLVVPEYMSQKSRQQLLSLQ